jgi:hypothetical protein
MSRAGRRLLPWLLVALGCDRSPATPAQAAPAAAPASAPAQRPGVGALSALPTEDLVGYLSGNYHTISNNPAVFADLDRRRIVMMGKSGRRELPIATRPAEAARQYEAFLLDNDYAANGKTRADPHPKVQVGSQEMVVVSMGELFPEMPADLKAHFAPAQLDVLYHLSGTEGYRLVAARGPVMWCYTGTVEVDGAGTKRAFPVEKANEAFAAFQALLPR